MLEEQQGQNLAVFDNLQFVRTQIRNRPSVCVGDADIEADEVHAGAEYSLAGPRGERRDRAQQENRDDEESAHF